MATYDTQIVSSKSQLELIVPDEDAFIVGNGSWQISDEPDKPGITVPSGVPFKIRGGRQFYATAGNFPLVLNMVSE